MPLVNKQIDLSIVILSYKSKSHLEVLLPSVFDSFGVDFSTPKLSSDEALAKSDGDRAAKARPYTAEIIIVDNDSRDGTAEWIKAEFCDFDGRQNHRMVSLIENSNNGFSKGNNLGIKQASGKYILLLNPDTRLEPGTLKTMLDFMDSRPDVGISGCKLIKADGKLDVACRRRFPNPSNSFKRLFLMDRIDYNYSDIDQDKEMEVDSVVGAFMLIRKLALDKTGLLDEIFFMYGEDLDLCWRCEEAGFKVWYYPKTFIHHYKGESSRKTPFKSLKDFHNAMWIFYKKHYAKNYFVIFNWLVWLGIYARLAVLVIINKFKANPSVSK